MNITDDIKELRERGFIRINLPGETDQYEIRVDLLGDDEPAITLDAVELLIEGRLRALGRVIELRDQLARTDMTTWLDGGAAAEALTAALEDDE